MLLLFQVFFIVITIAVGLSLTGWLADANCDNYQIFKVRSFIMFETTVLNSIGTITSLSLPSSGTGFATAIVLYILLHVLAIFITYSLLPAVQSHYN